MMAHRLRQDVKSPGSRPEPGTDPVNPHRDYWAPVKSIDVTET